MKTNIKMRVTPEQSRKVQEICFENGFEWCTSGKKFQGFYEWIYIGKKYMYCYSSIILEEIDADLFIRTNGTCEEDTFNELFEKVSKRVNDFQIGNMIEPIDKYRELEQKLKKKNEILKKARIKRKNQREELHKLNLKLQKCISFEEHNQIIEKLKAVIEYLESKVK